MTRGTECGLAAETKLLAPDGGLPVQRAAGKTIAVLTCGAQGELRFHLLHDIRRVADEQPVLAITVAGGPVFRVVPTQLVFTAAMELVAASVLSVGTELKPAYHYPGGYHYRTDTGDMKTSTGALRVTSIEAGGVATVYSVGGCESGCFFLEAGILCRAERRP